jgi:hypothetical protein
MDDQKEKISVHKPLYYQVDNIIILKSNKDPDPGSLKVTDPSGSGSGTLIFMLQLIPYEM